MFEKIVTFLGIVAAILLLGYAIGFIFHGAVAQTISEGLKSIGWMLFWIFSLIVRSIGEAVAAVAQVAMTFLQGQGSYLPNVPPLF